MIDKFVMISKSVIIIKSVMTMHIYEVFGIFKHTEKGASKNKDFLVTTPPHIMKILKLSIITQ
jgi:hypothetical protein